MNTPSPELNSVSSSFDQGILRNAWVRSLQETLAKQFWLEATFVRALILRESRGDTGAHSPTGAKGLMQLTESVFADMTDGRGSATYRAYFKKLEPLMPLILKHLKPGVDPSNLPDILRVLASSKTSKDRFAANIRVLQNTVKQEEKNGGYIVNLLIGSLYLELLKNSATQAQSRDVLRELKNSAVRVTDINPLLKHLGFAALTPERLRSMMESIQTGRGPAYQKYLMARNYNGDVNTSDASRVPHRILYALAVMTSSEQIADEVQVQMRVLADAVSHRSVAAQAASAPLARPVESIKQPKPITIQTVSAEVPKNSPPIQQIFDGVQQMLSQIFSA